MLNQKEAEALAEFEAIEHIIESKEIEFFIEDWRKDIDFSLYNISEPNSKQDTIEDEIKAWRKFYSNKTRKGTNRPFQTQLTTGDISSFIQSQLDFLSRYGGAVSGESLLEFATATQVRQMSTLPVASTITKYNKLATTVNRLAKAQGVRTVMKKITPNREGNSNEFQRQINKAQNYLSKTRDVPGQLSLLKQLLDVSYEGESGIIKAGSKILGRVLRGIPDGAFRDTFQSEMQKLLFNRKGAANARSIGAIAKLGVTHLFNEYGLRKDPGVLDKVTGIAFDFITNGFSPDTLLRASTGTITEIARKELMSVLGNVLVGKNKDLRASDIFESFLTATGTIKRDYKSLRHLFKYGFEDAVYKLAQGALEPLDFNKKIRELIRNSGRTAFRHAVSSVGLDYEDFQFLEKIAIRKLNILSGKFLSKMTDKIINKTISITDLLSKGDMWGGKTLNKFFEAGLLAADRNGLYEWFYGDTKHCGSCLVANGQRHRLKHWSNAGILPQSNGSKELICGGFYCQCELKRVTGKARGLLSSIPTAA